MFPQDDPVHTDPSVHERLVLSSTNFAQSAASAYLAETWEIFYLHLSTAIEQLVKAVLANVHPALIADKNADFETLLHLTGNKRFATTPESAVRTASASEAIRRVSHVVRDFRPPTARVSFVIDMRNGIVHAGHTARAEHEAVLGEAAAFVEQLLDHLRIATTTYWGPEADLIADHAKRRLDAIEAAVRRRVHAARERFDRILENLNDTELDAFVAAREPEGVFADFDAARADCPACGYIGLLSGNPEPEWDADWDSEGGEPYLAGAFVSSVRLYAVSFACGVCSLSLDAGALPFVGLSTAPITDEDADMSEATEFFVRQLAVDAGYDG